MCGQGGGTAGVTGSREPDVSGRVAPAEGEEHRTVFLPFSHVLAPSSPQLGSVSEPWQQSFALCAKRCGAAELTQHPHDSERDAVDE